MLNYFKNLGQKKGFCFFGGIVLGIFGGKILKSKATKKIAVKTLAGAMKLKENVDYTLAGIKEEAEDIYNETKEKNSNEDTCKTEV